jgi:hypothetical protein
MLPAILGPVPGPGFELAGEVHAHLTGDHVAVMLFGSCARGDQHVASDVDVLQVVERWRPSYAVGRISVSVYTCARLFELARSGSLFVLHLATEGRLIEDPTDTLSRILASYRTPSDYSGARDKLRRALSVLDVNRVAFERNPDGFLRVGLHILRTALYVRCIEQGTPVFSMPRVARLLGDPHIEELFVSRGPRGYAFFSELRARSRRELATAGINEFGSLEALAVALYEDCPIASQLALKLLRGDARIDYDSACLDWVADV